MRGILSMMLFKISGKFFRDHGLPSQLYAALEGSLLFFCLFPKLLSSQGPVT